MRHQSQRVILDAPLSVLDKMSAMDLRYEVRGPGVSAGGWVHIRFLNSEPVPAFPPICVNCLGPATERKWIRAGRTVPLFALPLCATCKRDWSRRERRSALVMALITAAVFAITVLLIRKLTDLSLAASIARGTISLALGLFISSLVLLRHGPVVQIGLAAFWGRLRIRFRNAAYAAIYSPPAKPVVSESPSA